MLVSLEYVLLCELRANIYAATFGAGATIGSKIVNGIF